MKWSIYDDDDLEDRGKAEQKISCGFSLSSSGLHFPISQSHKQNLSISIIFRPVIVVLQLNKLENANLKEITSLALVNPKQKIGWHLWVQKGQVIFSAFNALLSTHCLQFTDRVPAVGTLPWFPAPRTAHAHVLMWALLLTFLSHPKATNEELQRIQEIGWELTKIRDPFTYTYTHTPSI